MSVKGGETKTSPALPLPTQPQAPAVLPPSPLEKARPAQSATEPKIDIQGCHRVELDQTVAYVCVQKSPIWTPLANALPGVATAVIGFLVVHNLSVRRQRRDEQFKMVQAMRDLITAVAEEGREAWSKKSGRKAASQRLIHRVAAISRTAEMLRLRNKKFDVGEKVVAFRRAITSDIESGSVAIARRHTIASTAADLDEAVYRSYISIYG